MCPYRAYRPGYATPPPPESAPFCTVSGALSPTVFRVTFLPGLPGSPHSLHSLGECRTFARYRYTLHLAFPTMCPYRAIDQDTPLLPRRRVHRFTRFRGHPPLRFFVRPSFQASQFVRPSFQASQAALTVYTPWESAGLLPDTGTLSPWRFRQCVPAEHIGQITPLLPAGECTVLHGFGGTLPYRFSCNLPSKHLRQPSTLNNYHDAF